MGALLKVLRKQGSVVGAVDIDHLSIETYKANHPRVRVWESDIRELDAANVREALGLEVGALDLLSGCPPCQGFSKLKTLNGSRVIFDDRNDLLFEFLRFVKEFKPKAVMMENVPDLVKDKRFKSFQRRMRALGYRGRYRILDAAEYGVPQRRQRMIYLVGLHQRIPFGSPAKSRKTVRDTIARLPLAGSSGDKLHDITERRSARIKALIKKIPKDGGGRTDLPYKYQLDCHKRCNGFKDIYGRMAWDAVSPTITSGCFNPSKGRFLHPEEDRAITLREAALLQGFPHRYKFPITTNKSAVALMIGNALPPELIRRHAKSVFQTLITNGTANV